MSRQLARAHRHPVAAPLSIPPPIPLPAPIPIPVTVPMALSGSGRLRGRLTAVLIRAPEPLPAPTPVPVPMPDKPATTPPLVGKRPCAAAPFALVRWKPSRYSYQMREPTAYYASRELALAAAAILIDEPCPPTVVDATVTVEKRRPIDEILQDLQDRRGVIQTPYPGKRRDGLDDNEPPLKHSKAPRDWRPANDHPWNGGVDRSEVSTSWRVRLAGAGTLTAVTADPTVRLCAEPGCGCKATAGVLCASHYRRLRNGDDLNKPNDRAKDGWTSGLMPWPRRRSVGSAAAQR
jgi:hypothetical protein